MRVHSSRFRRVKCLQAWFADIEDYEDELRMILIKRNTLRDKSSLSIGPKDKHISQRQLVKGILVNPVE